MGDTGPDAAQPAPWRRQPGPATVWLTSGALLATLLAGCAGDDSQPSPSSGESSPIASSSIVAAPAGTPDAPVELGKVVWAERIDPVTGEPEAAVEAFPADVETIYALAPVRSAPAGSVVSAIWSLNDTPIRGTEQQVRIDQDVAGGWVAFHLTWTGEGGWPPGTLSVALTANGRSVGEGRVPVAR